MSFNFTGSEGPLGGIGGIDKLKAMSDTELIAYEDELLLKKESSPGLTIRVTSGRGVIFFLTVLYAGASFLLYASWRGKSGSNDSYGIFEIIVPIACILVGVVAADITWKKSGMWTRTIIRNLFHYWPVFVSLVIFSIISKKS